jgi:ferredoxin
LPAPAATALDQQLEVVAALLGATNYPADAVTRVEAAEFDPQSLPAWPLRPPVALFAAAGNKRQRLFTAIDHLSEHASDPPKTVALPPSAPFGRVAVNDERCTLCMACTSGCPAGALLAGGATPALRFIEANCVQCGICVETCPEQAITVAPHFTFDREARMTPVTLHEEAPFHCVSCGKPFATRHMIETILSRLEGNPMFQTDRARRRLQMCEDCRVIDIAQDDQAMAAGVFRRRGHVS